MPEVGGMDALALALKDGGLRERFVFIYGTLRRGERNDITQLKPEPCYVGHAALAGTLYHLGAYPGLLLAGANSAATDVVGEVYAIAPALEARLDEIEGILPQGGGEYAKRECLVELAGQLIACLVYEINPERLHGRPVIADGDWVRRSKFSQYENL